jgi:polar amino acid transport system substrate-binding protein
VSAADANCARLAPTGKLRAGMNLSNALFMTKDANGELRGVSVDLMREVASRLGVPVEFVVYPTPGNVADAAGSDQWDVAVLAIEQARAEKIAFSPPMTEIEATYAVRKDSLLKTIADVDASGVRISVADKAGYELYLTRTLRNASLIHARQLEGAIEVFNARKSDAVAGLRPAMLTAMPTMPDAKLLDGNFMTVNHGIGTPRGRGAGAECVKAIVDDLNASGFVARSIARNEIAGLLAVKQK